MFRSHDDLGKLCLDEHSVFSFGKGKTNPIENTMVIYPQTKTIRSFANGHVVVGLLMLFALIIVFYLDKDALSKEAFLDDPISFIIGVSGILWFSIFMIAQTTKLYKLSRLRGPLISICNDGIIDHFHSPQKLSWNQIKFVGCKETMGRNTYTYFVITPKKPN